MVAPARAWGVRLGVTNEDAEGTLYLEDDVLLFDLTHDAGVLEIPLQRIRKVKRLRGSPVLLVDSAEEDRTARFAFYFVKPPPLKPVGRESKRRAKRQAVTYLQQSNFRQVDRIKEWESALREAVAGSKG